MARVIMGGGVSNMLCPVQQVSETLTRDIFLTSAMSRGRGGAYIAL